MSCHEDDSATRHAGSDEERSTSSDSSASVDRSPDVVVSLPSLVPAIVEGPHMDNGAISVTLSGINGKTTIAEGVPVVRISTARPVLPLLAWIVLSDAQNKSGTSAVFAFLNTKGPLSPVEVSNMTSSSIKDKDLLLCVLRGSDAHLILFATKVSSCEVKNSAASHV